MAEKTIKYIKKPKKTIKDKLVEVQDTLEIKYAQAIQIKQMEKDNIEAKANAINQEIRACERELQLAVMKRAEIKSNLTKWKIEYDKLLTDIENETNIKVQGRTVDTITGIVS